MDQLSQPTDARAHPPYNSLTRVPIPEDLWGEIRFPTSVEDIQEIIAEDEDEEYELEDGIETILSLSDLITE